MALPFAAGAARLLYSMTRGALRQTKHLSPWKRSTGKIKPGIFKDGGYTGKTIKGPSQVGGKTLRPWAQSTLKGMKKVGFSKGAREKTLYGYSRAHKHVARHKKLYGSGVAGAAAWDILDND